MAIKHLVFALRQPLAESAGQAIGSGRTYELIAAAFGFRSHAALRATHVFASSGAAFEPLIDAVQSRAEGIGLTAERCPGIASAVCDALRTTGIVVISMTDLGLGLDALAEAWAPDWEEAEPWWIPIDESRFEWSEDDKPEDWLDDELLLQSLDDRAARHDPMALYRLAQLHWLACCGSEGSPHWHAERAKGEMLGEIQQGWAEQHARYLAYRQRLRETAVAGHREAALRYSEEFDDPLFFEQPHAPVDADPHEVARLAERLRRKKDAHHWFRIAATEGDIEAMRVLIEDYDHRDPVACWTWHHLALKLGEDLTVDRHVAINEDGSLWDDDIGGPAHVGGEDGVRLPKIQEVAHELAIREADRLHAAILEDDPDMDRLSS